VFVGSPTSDLLVTTPGWKDIAFDTPFVYNPDENQNIVWLFHTPGSAGASILGFRQEGGGTWGSRNFSIDGSSVPAVLTNETALGATTRPRRGDIANIRFRFAPIIDDLAPTTAKAFPSKFDFGQEAVGGTMLGGVETWGETRSFGIVNVGGGTLNISNVQVTGGDFVLASSSPTTGVLESGKSLIVYVNFRPQAIGSRNGQIIITHNAGAPLTIDLSGTGTPEMEKRVIFRSTFENGNDGWNLVNATRDNRWIIGVLAGDPVGNRVTNNSLDRFNRSLYITRQDNNCDWSGSYMQAIGTGVHSVAAWRNITIPHNAIDIELSFDMRGQPGTVPRLDIRLLLQTEMPTSGTAVNPSPAGQVLQNDIRNDFSTIPGQVSNATTWARQRIPISNIDTSTGEVQRRLVFYYIHGGSVGAIPPALDNIMITYRLRSAEAVAHISPTSHNFGDTPFGHPRNQTFTISNGGIAPLVITDIELAGVDADVGYFSFGNISHNFVENGNASLTGMQTITANVIFNATTVGAKKASLIVRGAANAVLLTADLDGVGAGPTFSVDPVSHDFGPVGPNTRPYRNFTIRNTGGNYLNILSIEIEGEHTDEFLLTHNTLPVAPGLVFNATFPFTVRLVEIKRLR
jgi:hypothetical protein